MSAPSPNQLDDELSPLVVALVVAPLGEADHRARRQSRGAPSMETFCTSIT